MTDLTQALFRIDPTEGLVEYVQAIKPYHSKILDIFVEYIYAETASVRVTDKMVMEIGFTSPGEGEPVMYACGYGIVWDAYGGVATGDLPTATIVAADPVTSTFTVSTPPAVQYNYAVTNLQANQMTLVDGAGVPLTPDNIPYIPSGAAVQVATTGTFPGPLTGTASYYLIPTASVGVFNLSTTRYPSQYSDYINLTSVGTGVQTVLRTEPFVPGDAIVVAGTPANDGEYFIDETVEPNGSNYTIGVVQAIPAAQGAGGTMTYMGNFGDPYCAIASAPDLFTGAFITESLHFQFSDDPTTGVANDPLGYDSPHGIDGSKADGLPHGFI